MDFIERHRDKFPPRATLPFVLWLTDHYPDKDFSKEELTVLFNCWDGAIQLIQDGVSKRMEARYPSSVRTGRVDTSNPNHANRPRGFVTEEVSSACTTDGRDVTPPQMGGAPEGFTKGGSFDVPLETEVAFPGQDYDKQSETDVELLTRLANRPSWTHRKKQLLGIVEKLERWGMLWLEEKKTCLCDVKIYMGSAHQGPGPQHTTSCPLWEPPHCACVLPDNPLANKPGPHHALHCSLRSRQVCECSVPLPRDLAVKPGPYHHPHCPAHEES